MDTVILIDRALRRAVVQNVIGALLGEPVRFYEVQIQEEENIEQQPLGEIEAGLGKDYMAGGVGDAQARARKDEQGGLGDVARRRGEGVDGELAVLAVGVLVQDAVRILSG